MLKPLWLMLLTPPLIAGCISASTNRPAPAELRPLIDTIGQRLDIANDVALSKFYSGKPVQDSDRERQVIANAEAQASLYKLDQDDVRQFMTAQIEANKTVQYARIEQWHANGKAPGQPNAGLMTAIRTRLDHLQPLMMERFAAFQPWRNDSDCQGWVSGEIEHTATDATMAKALQQATETLCMAQAKN